MTCLFNSVHYRLRSPFLAIWKQKISLSKQKKLDYNQRNSIHGNKEINQTEPLWWLHARLWRRTSPKKETNWTSSSLKNSTEPTRERDQKLRETRNRTRESHNRRRANELNIIKLWRIWLNQSRRDFDDIEDEKEQRPKERDTPFVSFRLKWATPILCCHVGGL